MPATVLIYISEAAQIAVVAVLSSTGPFWALETYLTTRKQFVPGTSVGPKASIWWMNRSQKQTKTLRRINIQNRPDLQAGSSIFLSISTKKETEKRTFLCFWILNDKFTIELSCLQKARHCKRQCKKSVLITANVCINRLSITNFLWLLLAVITFLVFSAILT